MIMLCLPSLLLINTAQIFAQSGFAKQESMTVWGHQNRRLTDPGASTLINQEALDTFKYTDINRLLRTVPGIQIQEEDGFGLRPNIGMRGAHPHRSRKVLIMEDGIPAGPAPYVAPAAYFVPSLALLEGVEVTKGPSAVRYGPQTIGGAINLKSRSIPEDGLVHRIDIAAGSFAFRKVFMETGGRHGKLGWLLLASQAKTEGFKRLLDDADTGFKKRDLMGKLSYQLNSSQELHLKIGWSDERSNETYLGLGQQDFAVDPYQRYRASQLDLMLNDRQAISLEHHWLFTHWNTRLVMYRHNFNRSWNKLNGFSDPSFDLRTVLTNPVGRYQHHYDVLRGSDDSLAQDDLLVIGNNDRSYYSQGVYWEGLAVLPGGQSGSHELEWGIRLHQDEIKRQHSEADYFMEDGVLVADGNGSRPTTRNQDQATAWSAHLMDTFRHGNWRYSFGLRQENVTMQRSLPDGSQSEKPINQSEFIPGIGIFQHLGEYMGWYFGVHRGIALAGFQDVGKGRPEESYNYELGLRLLQGRTLLEITSFWNDYRNIKGTCSFSTGCDQADLDKTYDGGKATVYGLEWNSSYTGSWLNYYWPLSLQYTYTQAEFASDFISDLVDWGIGEIRTGDPLPYIPAHQIAIQVGLRLGSWQISLLTRQQSSSYDQSAAEGREKIPASQVVDLAMSYFIAPSWEVYLNGDNLLKEESIVSLRPYGARPGKPQSFVIGTRASL